MQVKQFEYRKIDISDVDEDALANIGLAGWEMCGILYNTVGIFKRDLVDFEGESISYDYFLTAALVWQSLADRQYINLLGDHTHPYMRSVDGKYQHVTCRMEIDMLEFLIETRQARESTIVDGEYRTLAATMASTAKDSSYHRVIIPQMVASVIIKVKQ